MSGIDEAQCAAGAATPPEPKRLKFLMRSGNSMLADGVVSYEIEKSQITGRIVSLKLEQLTDPKYARMLVESVDLSQIEGVMILPAGGYARRMNEKDRGDER